MVVELALGTAQFGLTYGVAGRGEPVPEPEVRGILEYASRSGIRLLDTAGVYGDIEARLPRLCAGLGFRVVSKIPAVESRLTSTSAAQFVVDAIRRAKGRLGEMLETMLFHHAGDLLAAGGDSVWRAACESAQDAGLRLGVSCYAPEEVRSVRARFAVSVAQAPGNAFDQRLRSLDFSAELGEVELHMRSVFLQGLLLMRPEMAMRKVPAAAQRIAAWRAWCMNNGFSALLGALAVAKSFPGVKYVVVGVDNVEQLREIVSAWRSAPAVHDTSMASADPELVDPRRWSVA